MAISEPQFRKLIETHQRMVFSLALRILGDYATAEEVAQDVFLELYRSANGSRATTTYASGSDARRSTAPSMPCAGNRIDPRPMPTNGWSRISRRITRAD